MIVAISKFSTTYDLKPSRVELSWSDFVACVADAPSAPCTLVMCLRSSCPHKRGACWSPATYADGGARRDATSISLLAFDVEGATESQVAEIIGRISDYQHVVHATHSDRPGNRFVRIIILLSRPVSRDAWSSFWHAAQQNLVPIADPFCSDAGRIYFLPSRPLDADYFVQVNEGRPLDVDAVLASAVLTQDPDHVSHAVEGEVSP